MSAIRKIAALVADAVATAPMRIDQILVAQGKRRIDNGGDSQVRYKPLSAKQDSYRFGGMPLRDTSVFVYNTLNGSMERRGISEVRFTLLGSLIAVYHHHGFSTEGPNFIPLTRKAVRRHVTGRNPRVEGLKPGVDYRMAWGGVTVPARPIFNLPPEDVDEIADSIREAIRDRVGRAGSI